ncbi:LPXTG cell wall anchor domain-containing protein, partial [Olsenella umbonata]
VFSFSWKGVQLADGKDAVATDDEAIQLTVKPVKSAEPNPSSPTPTKPSTAKPTGSKGSGSARKPAGKPVVGKTVGRGSKGVPKTGDATLPAGAVGVMVLGGAAAIAIGARRRRRRQE